MERCVAVDCHRRVHAGHGGGCGGEIGTEEREQEGSDITEGRGKRRVRSRKLWGCYWILHSGKLCIVTYADIAPHKALCFCGSLGMAPFPVSRRNRELCEPQYLPLLLSIEINSPYDIRSICVVITKMWQHNIYDNITCMYTSRFVNMHAVCLRHAHNLVCLHF